MKKSLVLGAAIILSLSLASCNGDNKTTDNTIHVESVSVASIHELEVGETFTVGTNTVTVLPDNATDKSYSLSSSDMDVFTTSGYVITAVGEGTADLTVTTTDGGFKASTLITVIGTGGDDNPNTGGEGGDGGDDQPGTGGEGGGTEPGPSEPDKDVTITTDPESITVKGGESTSFTITVTEGASILSVVSDNDAVVVSGSGTDWTVTATNNGEGNITATITITAGGTGFNTATATLPVTVTPADYYTYTLSLDNTSSVPTDWYYDDTEKSFEITGTLHVLNRGIEETESAIALTSANATVTVDNDEHNAESIINVSGLTISPAGGVGQVVVTVTYSADDPSGAQGASQTFTIEVQERYTTTHEIKIDQTSVPTTTQVGESEFDIGATLTTKTTAGSTSETESGSRALTDEDVSSGKVTITCNPAEAFTINGRHAIPNGSYNFGENESVEVTFTVAWVEYAEEGDGVTDSATTTLSPKEGAVYTMTLTNATELTTDWHSEDEARTAELTLASSDPEEDPAPTIEGIISDGELVVNISGESITKGEGTDILTFTPVKAGTSTVVIYWSEHTEANVSFSVTISDYSYEISITNKTELQESWSIEDAEARTLSVSLTTDRADITTAVSTENVKVTYDESVFTTSDGGFTLTPQGTAAAGDYTITVEWIDSSIREDLRVSDSVTVTLDDTIKVTNISLSPASINWDAPSSTTLTATLTGKDGKTATSTAVTWSIEGDDTITLQSDGGLSATVTASAYSATATITAAATENSNISASCEVTVADKVIQYTPALVEREVLASTVVDTPDADGVYVLGYQGEEDTFITYNASFATTDSYGAATAVRTVLSGDEGYVLEVGGQYITASGGLSTEGAVVTIGDDGKIANGSNYLGWQDDSLVWSTSPINYLYLLDMDYVLTYDSITSSDDVNYNIYFAADVNGDYYYWDGTASSGHGGTTDDISQAAVMTVTCIEDNRYYLKTGSNYMYINGSGNTNFATSASEQVLSYDADGNYWLGNPDSTNDVNTRTFAWYGTDKQIRTYVASNDSAGTKFKLVAEPEEATLKGITLHSTTDSVNSGESTTLTYSLYPSAVHHADLTWISSDDNAATVVDGVVYGNSTSEGVTITAKCGDVEALIVLAIAGADPTYIGTLALGASCGSTSSPGTSAKYTTSTLQTLLDDAYTGSGTIKAGDTDYCYRTSGNTSGTGLCGSNDCFRMSSSSNAGSFAFYFEETDILVGRIEIVIAYYDSANQTIKVNDDSTFTVAYNAASYTDWNVVPSTSFSFTPSNSVKFDAVTASKHRHLIYSIALYTE